MVTIFATRSNARTPNPVPVRRISSGDRNTPRSRVSCGRPRKRRLCLTGISCPAVSWGVASPPEIFCAWRASCVRLCRDDRQPPARADSPRRYPIRDGPCHLSSFSPVVAPCPLHERGVVEQPLKPRGERKEGALHLPQGASSMASDQLRIHSDFSRLYAGMPFSCSVVVVTWPITELSLLRPTRSWFQFSAT